MRRIHAKNHALGPNMQVARVVPQLACRHVGPFVFIDHFGPVHMPKRGMAVRPHPHIGLATVTVLYQGHIRHRDSLGSDQWIRPGDVNWMTAGHGIVHSERNEDHEGLFHGLQFWVALPNGHEDTEPSFHHHPADAIPHFGTDGVQADLYVGDWGDHTSPVATFGPTLLLLVRLNAGASFALPVAPEGQERGILVTSGALSLPDGSLESDTLVLTDGSVNMHAEEPTTFAVLGGQPVGERRMAWNFVHSNAKRIEAAKERWRSRGFPQIPGDDSEFVPLPS